MPDKPNPTPIQQLHERPGERDLDPALRRDRLQVRAAPSGRPGPARCRLEGSGHTRDAQFAEGADYFGEGHSGLLVMRSMRARYSVSWRMSGSTCLRPSAAGSRARGSASRSGTWQRPSPERPHARRRRPRHRTSATERGRPGSGARRSRRRSRGCAATVPICGTTRPARARRSSVVGGPVLGVDGRARGAGARAEAGRSWVDEAHHALVHCAWISRPIQPGGGT